MIDWPKFRYAEVLPGNRPETLAERHSRVRREYGDYVRRQYGIGGVGGKRRWSADTSALMRLSGDDGGVAFRSVAFNRVRNEPRVPEVSISEAVKKMIAKEGTPGVLREEIPKEVPEERSSAGGEIRDVCAVASSELKSEAERIEEIKKEEPPVEKEESVDFKKALEILVVQDEDEITWFGSVTSWFKKIRVSGVPWWGTAEEAPKSSDEFGDLGENREDFVPDGSEQVVQEEARWKVIATNLYRESLDFVRDFIQECLEWMITAVDWFIGRGQFGFIDNFGGFRK